MDKVKFIYFDIGGVTIVDFSGTNKWAEMLKGLGLPNDRFAEFEAYYDELNPKLHTGELDVPSLQKMLNEKFALNLPSDYDMLQDLIDRFEVNHHIHPAVQKAKENNEVGLLTNMYTDMLGLIQEAELLPPVEWDVVVDSSIEKLQKPERAIYELAEQRCGYGGREIFFVDNYTENIEAAKELGWQTFHYDHNDHAESSRQLSKFFK